MSERGDERLQETGLTTDFRFPSLNPKNDFPDFSPSGFPCRRLFLRPDPDPDPVVCSVFSVSGVAIVACPSTSDQQVVEQEPTLAAAVCLTVGFLVGIEPEPVPETDGSRDRDTGLAISDRDWSTQGEYEFERT